MPPSVRRGLTLAGLGGLGLGIYALLVRGSLTVDVGIGRSLRALGPLTWRIEAPREVVFAVISGPYLERAPRALQSKLRVVERSETLVLAEHFTSHGPVVTTTLETVAFEAPERISFRLVRGPVPHVVEQFELRENGTGTELRYTGEMETDFWAVGRLWGALVAWRWETAVRGSLNAVKAEAERRTGPDSPARTTGSETA